MSSAAEANPRGEPKLVLLLLLELLPLSLVLALLVLPMPLQPAHRLYRAQQTVPSLLVHFFGLGSLARLLPQHPAGVREIQRQRFVVPGIDRGPCFQRLAQRILDAGYGPRRGPRSLAVDAQHPAGLALLRCGGVLL